MKITGALMISEDAFVQVLEGDETEVRALFTTIARDDRHDQVRVLEEQDAVDRTFGRWAMARVGESGAPDIRLLSNAERRGDRHRSPPIRRSPRLRSRCWR